MGLRVSSRTAPTIFASCCDGVAEPQEIVRFELAGVEPKIHFVEFVGVLEEFLLPREPNTPLIKEYLVFL